MHSAGVAGTHATPSAMCPPITRAAMIAHLVYYFGYPRDYLDTLQDNELHDIIVKAGHLPPEP